MDMSVPDARAEVAATRGVYTADRAGALAGVPKSTVYYWARKRVITPSVSAEKLKLWSWADLVALRAVYWLRHPGVDERRKPTSMSVVRDLIDKVEERVGKLGEAISSSAVVLRVDIGGAVYLDVEGHLTESRHQWRQRVEQGLVIDLLSPFSTESHTRGPHLLRPRPALRIIPGKLSGEPHIENTRIETRVVWALHQRGFTARDIANMYGEVSVSAVEDAVDLEQQLERNLLAA